MERHENPSFSKEDLIKTIIDLAQDENDSKEDLIKLAKATDDELVEMVMNLAYYYHAELND